VWAASGDVKPEGARKPIRVRLRRWLSGPRSVAAETVHGFLSDRGTDLAASLAFSTLLTAVPLLATFSLLVATFFEQNVSEVLDVVNALLPYHSARLTKNLRDFVAESRAISGIGLALLLAASLRLIFIVEGIFNAVWGAPRRRAPLARAAVYTLILFALGLLLGAVGLGLRHLQASAVGERLLGSPLLDTLFPFAIELAALVLLYRFLPNARVRWLPALSGAGFAAVSLELLRSLFGLYVQALSRMNLITGSLALVLLSLVSIYFVWVLILLGVELASVVQKRMARKAVMSPPDLTVKET
jgi:membrane protein